jgi:hypothetical protein
LKTIFIAGDLVLGRVYKLRQFAQAQPSEQPPFAQVGANAPLVIADAGHFEHCRYHALGKEGFGRFVAVSFAPIILM